MRITAIFAALALTACANGPAVSSHRDTSLGLDFQLDRRFVVAPCAVESEGCINITDARGQELFSVTRHDVGVELTAREAAGFERDEHGVLMTTYGRFMPMPVEAFERDGLKGYRAVVTCGISDPETGFHAAAGECLWVVIGDDARSAVIVSSGLPDGLTAAERAVATLSLPPLP